MTDQRLVLETEYGSSRIRLFANAAPKSVTAFLDALESGVLEKLAFTRSVNKDNDRSRTPIEVLQAGPTTNIIAPQVPHEPTSQTGLRHLDGTVSLARLTPGSAQPCHFFICLDDQPHLDEGGLRPDDGLGFAAFARVEAGMDTVRTIAALPAPFDEKHGEFSGQLLKAPVPITAIRRSD